MVLIMEEINNKKQELVNTEYEVQFFGDTAQFISEEVVDLVKSDIEDCISQYVDLLKVKSNMHDDNKVKKIERMLLRIYENASEVPLNNCLEDVKKLFRIPSHTLLPEDKLQLNQYSTENDINKIDFEIQQLREEYKKVKYIEESLKQELKITSYINNAKTELLTTEQ